MLDITVCIMSYNRPAYLREAVHSILAQTRQPKKIVIYDNGSDQSVHEGVKEFFDQGVLWVGAEVNHPFIWNFNRALHDSETNYTMFMHDDDRLSPDFLAVQTGLLDADPNLAVVSCNGYFIGGDGSRTGGTLAPIPDGMPVELYACSGQVALKFASNSCIPFSPAIYRSEIARSVQFRDEFSKVCDAVYFCDLAENNSIAYQTRPLYESRLHAGQDSSHFPYDLMNRLEEFYRTRNCVNDAEKSKLHQLLLRQHTTRNLRQIFSAIKKGDFSLVGSLLMDKKFKIADAAIVLSAWTARMHVRRGSK